MPLNHITDAEFSSHSSAFDLFRIRADWSTVRKPLSRDLPGSLAFFFRVRVANLVRYQPPDDDRQSEHDKHGKHEKQSGVHGSPASLAVQRIRLLEQPLPGEQRGNENRQAMQQQDGAKKTAEPQRRLS
jgi:hypothetical protein